MSELCCNELDINVQSQYIEWCEDQKIWVANFADRPTEDEDFSYGCDEVIIKYCPFCGRKLE